MKLTDKACQALLATPHVMKKLSDGGGLVLFSNGNGGLYWHGRVYIDGKETTLSHGLYPFVSLKEARALHIDKVREMKRTGANPNHEKRRMRIEGAVAAQRTFEYVVAEWYPKFAPARAESYTSKVLGSLRKHVFSKLGKIAISEIRPPMINGLLEKLVAVNKIETAHRVLTACSQVFDYAISMGWITINPCASLARHLPSANPTHMAAILDRQALGDCLRAMYGYEGSDAVCAALKLLPMLLLRPGELRQGRWEEIDLENAVWRVPSSRMKRTKQHKLAGDDHVVPLSTQAVAILSDLKSQGTGEGFVFKGQRDHDRPMSDAAINRALQAMGYDTRKEVTGHGFRATARTLLEEYLNFPPEIIEAQLAHSVKGSLGRAYNRTEYLERRKEMMQAYADFLDDVRRTARRPQITIDDAPNRVRLQPNQSRPALGA